MTDKLFTYVSKPPFYRRTRECELFNGWVRVNVYSHAEVSEGIWGLRMSASYVVRDDGDGGLDFHHTTPVGGKR